MSPFFVKKDPRVDMPQRGKELLGPRLVSGSIDYQCPETRYVLLVTPE